MQQSTAPQRTAFAVLHRGPGGEGTGYTIVFCRNEALARVIVGDYLMGKGEEQFTSRHLLEVMLLEESIFADHFIDQREGGIVAEYWFKPGEEEGEPTKLYPLEAQPAL